METENGQKRSASIFQYFQEQADDLAEKGAILIYPGGRWLHQSGKGMKKFGNEQLNDVHLSRVEFYPNAKEIFSTVDIADGITIVMKNYKKTQPGFEYRYIKDGVQSVIQADNPGDSPMILNPNDVNVISKIDQFVKKNNLDYLDKKILSQKLFRIESDFVSKNPDSVRPYTMGDDFDRKTEIKLFTNDKAGKAGRAKWYIANRNVIQYNEQYIDEYQVVVSSANAGGQKRDNQLEIIDNYSAFGRARVALNSFKTLEEAKNFYKYCCTYIVRFAFLMTDEALTSLARKVPDLLNYRNNNDLVDFKADLDEQLFKLMDISADETAYIKSVIDNMDRKRGKV